VTHCAQADPAILFPGDETQGGVKSLSEETRQKPSSRPLCKRSMASITKAMSDAFFPSRVGQTVVGGRSRIFGGCPPRLQALAREITIDPPDTCLTELATSSKSPAAMRGEVLSASMRIHARGLGILPRW